MLEENRRSNQNSVKRKQLSKIDFTSGEYTVQSNTNSTFGSMYFFCLHCVWDATTVCSVAILDFTYQTMLKCFSPPV